MFKNYSFCLLLLYLGIQCSCNAQNKNIIVDSIPVWVESDTSRFSLTHINFSKREYFLVTGDVKNRKAFQKKLDEFLAGIKGKKDSSYINHLFIFYKVSSYVNKHNVLQLPNEVRYKIFDENQEDFLVSYTYRRDGGIFVEWNDRYK